VKLDPPHVHPVSNDQYQLDHDYRATAAGWWIHIRAGFITDGASVPRLLWRVVGHPFQGRALAAAIVHDALYQVEAIPRAEADRVFYELLIANGVSRGKAWAMFAGVRIGGGFVWAQHDLSDIALIKPFVEVKKVESAK
jgi:hypothetical protein